MAIDLASAIKLFSGMGMDKNVIRQIGAELARGMQEGGNASGYSSTSPSGGDAGVAGGRGGGAIRKSEEQEIKNSQMLAETQKTLIGGMRRMVKSLKVSGLGLKDQQKEIEAFSSVFTRRWDTVLDKVGDSVKSQQMLIKNLNDVGLKDIETMEDVLKLREKQLALEHKMKTATGFERLAIMEQVKKYKLLSEQLVVATERIESAGESFGEAARQAIKGFASWQAGLTNLLISLKQLANDVKAQLRFGSMMDVLESQTHAMYAGVDPAAFAEMAAKARQASLQFSSMSEYTETLRVQQRELFQSIGDTTASMQMANDMLFLLGRSGVKPTAEAMTGMTESFHFLNRAVGLTSDQFTGIMEGLTMEESIQTKLRAARGKERQEILNGIARRLEENVAMGMTIEQAHAAATAMGRIAGGGAKERFKQAAKTQSMMAAMGIAGGDRAAELIRKGQRITTGEKSELQGLMGQVSDAAAASKMGAIGTELMVDTMLDKSGMAEFLGPNSPFNTAQLEATEISKTGLAAIQESIREGFGLTEKAIFATDVAQNFIENSALWKAVVGVGQIFADLLVPYIAFMMAKSVVGGAAGKAGMLGRAGGWLGKAGRGIMGVGGRIAGGLATAGSGLAAGAGTLATGALGVGAAGAAGYGVGTLLNKIPEFMGFDSISTNIVDGIERLMGTAYDPNADVVSSTQTVAKAVEDASTEATEARVEEQIAIQAPIVQPMESINEQTGLLAQYAASSDSTLGNIETLLTTSLELQIGGLTDAKAKDRLTAMDQNSMGARLSST